MLKEKTAIITGAARGIGAAIAKKMAQNGANVAIIDYGNEELGKIVVAEVIEKYGIKAAFYKCDVTDFEKCKEVVSLVTDEIGKPDILVNNAGITRDNLMLTMSEEEFDSVIGTNLKGTYNMTKACSRGFLRQKKGKIINLSSISGMTGLAGQTNYSASKAGVIGLTKAVAKEFGGKNICCNAIAPGFITTEMTQDLPAEDFINSIPLKRAGTPNDVANLALFLASELSDYITGEVIRVDVGLAM